VTVRRGRAVARVARAVRWSVATPILLLATGCGHSSPADYTDDEARAYIVARDFEFTPEEFVRSARTDALDVVMAFLAAGMDPNALGGRPLALAAAEGEIDILRQLLDAGADPNLPGGSIGQTPLVSAVINDHSDAAELLLGAGADPDLASRSGAVALHFAKDEATARLLLEAGADPGVADSRGSTPLMAAVMLGDVDLVEILLEHGADPDAADREGRTALLYSSVLSFARIEERLIAAGAVKPPPLHLDLATLESYSGRYRSADRRSYELVHQQGRLHLVEVAADGLLFANELVALTLTTFYRAGDPGLVLFAIRIEDDRVTGLSRTERLGWVTSPRLEETDAASEDDSAPGRPTS
jgi:hypothetical protein